MRRTGGDHTSVMITILRKDREEGGGTLRRPTTLSLLVEPHSHGNGEAEFCDN